MAILQSLLEDVRNRCRHFVVYASEPGVASTRWFQNHNVDVTYQRLPEGGPRGFLVVESDGNFVGAVGLDRLNSLLEPPVVPPTDLSEVSPGYQILFDMLAETVYTAMTRRELLAVSREIEDRAYRVGGGTLLVSFQRFSRFEMQREIYHHLATDTDLEIHIYGHRDWTPPDVEGITYHGFTSDPLEQFWALAFDGGSEREQACGLLAREAPPDTYYGFWTNDQAVVRRLLAGFDAE